jgi:hypothetical protein
LDAVGHRIVRELIDKTDRVVPGADWQVHYAFFARAGFTEAALAEADRIDAQFIDLARLDHDLQAGT